MVATRMGLSLEELVILATTRLLDSPTDLVSYELALEHVEKAKVGEALSECPELRHFLKSDLAVADKLGCKTKDTNKDKDPGKEVAPAKEIPWPDEFGSDWKVDEN